MLRSSSSIATRPHSQGLVQRHAATLNDAFDLPPEDVVEAVGKAGNRVTAADVAAAGGMSLEKARKGLASLAAAVGKDVNLEVSKSGEIVYAFQGDANSALGKASAAASLRNTWNSAKPLVLSGLRIAFGVGLFASIAIVYSAIIVISSQSSDREDRDDRRGGGGFGGGGGGFGFGPALWYGPSPFDLFWYQPYYTYGGYDYGYEYEQPKPKMGFLEAVYSFVFGDGDPNNSRDQAELAAVAAAARRNGGVLTAEQMAPLLDPPPYRKSGESYNVDESWVLKAVTKLNGRPEVTSSGEIVYVFDDLQTTAAGERGSRPPAIIEEKEVPFSLADEGQLFFAGLLGAANLVGAGYLGLQLARFPAGMVLPGFLGTVQFLYPALIAYAVSFFAAPAWRWFRNKSLNQAIEERNEQRRQWLRVLQSGEADGKLAEARTWRSSMRLVGSKEDSVYSTGKDATSQATEKAMADFDRQLGGIS